MAKGYKFFLHCSHPQGPEPSKDKGFQAYRLINSTMKIFTKVLTNILSPLMMSIVDDCHNGFIKGRQAAKSILVVREVVRSFKEGKREDSI